MGLSANDGMEFASGGTGDMLEGDCVWESELMREDCSLIWAGGVEKCVNTKQGAGDVG